MKSSQDLEPRVSHTNTCTKSKMVDLTIRNDKNSKYRSKAVRSNRIGWWSKKGKGRKSMVGWKIKILRGQAKFARMMIVNGWTGSWQRSAIPALVKSPLLVHPLSIYGRVLSIDSGLEGVARMSPTYDTTASSTDVPTFLRRYSHCTAWFLLVRIYSRCHLVSQEKRSKDKAL